MEHADRERLAFITGGSSGIGRALALRLAANGWRVVIASRRREALEAVAAERPDLADRLFPKALDVTAVDDFRAVYEEAEAELGPVDTLVLNAGGYEPMALDAFEPVLFRRLMEVNYLGAVNGIAAALPAMRARRDGQVLITASIAAYRGLPRAAPYSASKAAALGLAEALRPEMEAAGIRLRVISPGFVRTPLTDKNDFRMPQLMAPDDAAAYIHRELDGDGFEILFPKRLGWTMKLLRVLPYRLYFVATRRMVAR